MSVRAARLVDALGTVAFASNDASSAEEAFRTALTEVCAATGWPVGHAYVAAPEGLVEIGTWHLADAARYEPVRRSLAGGRVGPDQGPAGRALTSGVPERTDDVSGDATFAGRDASSQAGLRAAYAIPVPVGDEVVAVLEFLFSEVEPADPELPAALEAVGVVLGRIVERARAEDTLRRVRDDLEARVAELEDRPPVPSGGETIRDPLTGLFSSAFAAEALGLETMRAGRSRRAVAVIALGVDVASPARGDDVVRAAAELLQSRVRGGDVLARHGDEFVVVLPGVSLGMGRARAQQLRKGLAELMVEGAGETLEASAGLACFPEHGATAATLLGGAMDALHQIMARGGGSVELAKVSHEKWEGKRGAARG